MEQQLTLLPSLRAALSISELATSPEDVERAVRARGRQSGSTKSTLFCAPHPSQFQALRRAIDSAREAVNALPDDTSTVAEIEAEICRVQAQLQSRR